MEKEMESAMESKITQGYMGIYCPNNGEPNGRENKQIK